MRQKMRFFTLVLCFFVLGAGCGKRDGAASAEGSSSSYSSAAASEPAGPDPSGDSGAPREGDGSPVMTLVEAISFFQGLSPQVLGLEGSSMLDYQVYPGESLVPVDGIFCTKLSVFSSDEAAGTNRFEGVYLLARDRSRLYSLNQRTDEVTELALPGNAVS